MAGDHNDEEGGKTKPVPFPRTIFLRDAKNVISSQNKQTNRTEENNRLPRNQTLPARTCKENTLKPDPGFISAVSHTLPRTIHKATTSVSISASFAGSKESLSASSHSLPSDWENFLEKATPSIAKPVLGVRGDINSEGCSTGFQGVMVDNEIYESSPLRVSGPRSTHSYKLRHRPVPEIPECTIIPPNDWYVVARYTVLSTELCLCFIVLCLSKINRMYKHSIMTNGRSKQIRCLRVMFHW